jgi:hypothetical protein
MIDTFTSSDDAEPAVDDADDAPGRCRIGSRFRAWAASVPARARGLTIEQWVTLFVVAACSAFVFAQLHPSKILLDTTPAGGDMGAHVWGPAYLRDHLLPQGRLTGWTPAWYAGFPAYTFYMVVPSLVIALLSYLVPYGTAFKLVAVSGCVTLPIAAWFFGRNTRLPFPAPALLAVGATLFLFDRSFSIYGGNIPSTLAGEFAFSIALTFALLYLGMLARGLETGRHRGWAAVLLALTALCHLIPLIFALVGTALWFVFRPGKAQAWYLVTVLPVAGAISGFWSVPFLLRHRYMNDMGWEKIERYGNYLWDRAKLDPQLVNHPDLHWVIAIAAVGLLLSVVYRRRAGVYLAVFALIWALAFRYLPQQRLWNARLLPFYYLSLYLLAAIGVAEVLRLVSALFARDVNRPLRSVQAVGAVVAMAMALIVVALPLRVLPRGTVGTDGTFRWGPLSTKETSFIKGWANWNFIGYEGTWEPTEGAPPQYQKRYREYHDIVTTMAALGEDPAHGCGRAMWEHEEAHNEYGTPMALMLLPHWTDGCIGSMEGLYFEASSTTPYHFINQDQLSSKPSNAQRDLPYNAGPPSQLEFDQGISHLQMLGVKYYMAISNKMKDFADQNSSLTQVAESGPWIVYQVADAELVTGLVNEPAVVTNINTPLPQDFLAPRGDEPAKKKTGSPWQFTAMDWYTDPSAWDVFLAQDGPSSWQRVARGQPPEPRAQQPVAVTNIETDNSSISFDVDQIGVPVLVKASYFPNWKVTGADGPWRITPNLMVVVPTSNEVRLHYGYTWVDALGYALTILGLLGLLVLFRQPPLSVAPARRFWGRSERPDLYPPVLPVDAEKTEAVQSWLGIEPDDHDAQLPPWLPTPTEEGPEPPTEPHRPDDVLASLDQLVAEARAQSGIADLETPDASPGAGDGHADGDTGPLGPGEVP